MRHWFPCHIRKILRFGSAQTGLSIIQKKSGKLKSLIRILLLSNYGNSGATSGPSTATGVHDTEISGQPGIPEIPETNDDGNLNLDQSPNNHQ